MISIMERLSAFFVRDGRRVSLFAKKNIGIDSVLINKDRIGLAGRSNN